MGNTSDHTDLFELLRNGDRGALARAITLVESRKSTADEGVRRLIDAAVRLNSSHSLRIGITGSPGVGKSTLIDELGMRLIAAGKRVAVLAIDPSSTHSGGSILGDKTRMARLAAEPDAFIRPSPTGGTLGGVARRTREAIILCEAAGFDRILVETVGVGQSEAEVDQLTDITLLLMIGGAGDSLQGIKRGIMETADIIAITKTDGDDTRRNEVAARDLRNAIALLPARPTGLRPPVLLCSAVTGNGMAELLGTLNSAAERARTNGHLDGRRRDQRLQWLEAAITDTLVDVFQADPGVSKEWKAMRNAVATGVLSPGDAADRLVRLFRTAS
ncbi:MAG: methylmalonyl Co-A mutase-associated GTPase MeaB [Flavobacteriales bacterium]|nr:methylmalonyl Co-A mutase-associated GTPase MeaB [Flavobacteriales bacterium]